MSIQSLSADLTKLYFRIVFATIFTTLIIIGIAMLANFHGALWIPGIFFLISVGTQVILSYSPPALIFSGLVSLYTLIPLVGDMSVGKTAENLHSQIKQMLNVIFTTLALVFLFLFVVYIDSDYTTRFSIVFCFFTGFAILAWHSYKTKSNTQIIGKFVFLAGLLVIAKATALLFPLPIHDILGIYPGVSVDQKPVMLKTKNIAQRDADVLNKRGIRTLTEFEEIANRFPDKTSDEIIEKRNELFENNSHELQVVTEEMNRRKSTTTKKVLQKTAEFGSAVTSAFASKPELEWIRVGEIKYTPNQPDWYTQKVSVPAGNGKCRVKCVWGYNQYFNDLGMTEYVKPDGRSSAINLALEDSRFEPLAQLIKIDGIIKPVESHEFDCGTEFEVSLKPNLRQTQPNEFDRNIGRALFDIEKQLPKRS